MRLIETTEKQQHAGQAGYAVTTTSGGALLLEAVVPQLAVVLLSLPLKSCGWDLTDASSVRVTAESTRTPPRWSQSGVLAMSSMTTCNQVAFNLPSAKSGM